MHHRIMVCAAAAAVFAGRAPAMYTVSVLSAGSGSVTVAPGDTLVLTVSITSNASDVHNSGICRIEFSDPGVIYQSYAWAAPYATGTIFDDSVPKIADLPAALTSALLQGPGYPNAVVDIELSNVVPSGTFGVGPMVMLTMQVPWSWSGPATVKISAAPDTFAHGFDVVPTVAGSQFVLNIVPCPSVAAALVCSVAAVGVRRRRRENLYRSADLSRG